MKRRAPGHTWHVTAIGVRKVCPGCGEDKSYEEYPKDRARKYGRGYLCCECESERKTEYYHRKHPSAKRVGKYERKAA